MSLHRVDSDKYSKAHKEYKMTGIDQILMTEAFDDDSTYQLPVSLLNAKQKPWQTFAVSTPEGTPIVVKFAGTSELGETVKPLKTSDKSMQVILFGLSDKGNLAELKNGLSDDPIAFINTLLGLVKDKIQTQHLETVMFRFPLKKMQGKQAQVQRIIKMIARKKFPTFTTLDEVNEVSKKHAYIVLYKKSSGLESKGLPAVSERFTKVDTKVGETYVDTTNGKQVSKPQAIALEIVTASDQTTDKSIMMKTKISRRAAIQAQDATMTGLVSRTKMQEENYQKLMSEPPIHSAIDDQVSKTFTSTFDAVPEIEEGDAVIDTIDDVLNRNMAVGTKTPVSALSTEQEASIAMMRRKVIELLDSGLTTSNSFDKFKELAKILADDPYMSTNIQMRDNTLRGLCTALANQYKGHIAFRYSDLEAHTFTKDQASAVSAYCGNAFKDVNRYLLGLDKTSTTTDKYIKDLDSAFGTTGIKLPAKTVLYRGHKSNSDEAARMAKDKLFVFKNYVSTSMIPIIFTTNHFTVYGTSASLDSSIAVTTGDAPDPTFIKRAKDDFTISESADYIYAFAISGVDKVKVIVPGAHTKYDEEAEVILPRGTVLKINKISAAPGRPERTNVLQFLIQATVVPVEQLDENVELHDGDLLVETGEVKKVKGFKAIFEAKQSALEDEYLEILAGAISTDMPEKFVL